MSLAPAARPFTVFLIAGEESGDQLAAGLMQALRGRIPEARFLGVGGERMARLGLRSLFPMGEIALHGITAVLRKLPELLRLIRSTARAVIEAKPDVLVIVDSPDFNLRVAKAVRMADPSIAIVDYVSPSVWVWRSGRARAMRPYVDHVLALLPFEPGVHHRLGGPPCTYVGHPLIERLDALRPAPGERPPLAAGAGPTLLVLPGSRRSEVSRLLAPFGETVRLLAARIAGLEVVVPAVTRFAAEIRAACGGWGVPVAVVEGEAAKFAAFRRAHAALAASGTVTLELALAGVPMVVAYRVDPLAKLLKPFVTAGMKGPVKSIVLPNLILAAKAIPEFIDGDSAPANLAAALTPLLADTPQRRRQVEAMARLDAVMSTEGIAPSEKAAAIVIETAADRRAAA
ncbi:MAG TPA: lipid-A-disaccharide synthase [Bauldia sp.]|nr:lipid-A-disaccharide synthase [Bauldia sp.]